jgi:hypothetical protein
VAEQRDVKVFISWSGDLGKAVAVALRGWLPLLFDRVEPWASDTDIAAGQRGLAQIEQELQGTQFGIVVVTAANQTAPWLNFEAGALSKSIPGDIDQRVVPLLVDLTGPTQLTGPLSQFQAKAASREGVLSLLLSLGAVAGIDERVVEARFAAYWGDLETRLETAKADEATTRAQPVKPRRDATDLLDEILLHVRALRSESDSVSTRSRDTKNRTGAGFNDFLDSAAKQYDLRVMSYPGPRGQDPRTVWVEPIGKYSEDDVEEFKKYVRKRAADDRDVVIEAVPF